MPPSAACSAHDQHRELFQPEDYDAATGVRFTPIVPVYKTVTANANITNISFNLTPDIM